MPPSRSLPKDDQKLALASSVTLTLKRPDKIRVTRAGGFADVEMPFDGKTLTLLGKNLNLNTQLEVPGTITCTHRFTNHNIL